MGVHFLDSPHELKWNQTMWYFAWILGVGFAVLLAVMNAMWGENEEARLAARKADQEKS